MESILFLKRDTLVRPYMILLTVRALKPFPLDFITNTGGRKIVLQLEAHFLILLHKIEDVFRFFNLSFSQTQK